MESVKRFINVPNVVLALAVVFVIALGWPWGAVAAAWVQAIGSVLAIVAAILIARHQHDSETSRLKAQERERQVGLATRLYLFSLEYHSYVTKVVALEWQDGMEDVDKRNAFVFERLLLRLNANFDDDLSQARCVQVYTLKTSITGLVFLLQNTNGVDGGAIRSQQVEHYQKISLQLLEQCETLLSQAKKTP